MKYLLLSLLFLSTFLQAQNPVPENSASNSFQSGMELYDAGRFVAARAAFDRYIKSYAGDYRNPDAHYMSALCAIKAEQDDAEELMNRFIARFPGDPKSLTAYFDLGVYYFNQGQYGKAISMLEKADLANLSQAKYYEGNFKLGYAFINRNQTEKALKSLDVVSRVQNDFYYDGLYYRGYIYYEGGDYASALNDLLKAGEDEKYRAVVANMVASAYLKLNKYDELLKYVEGLGQEKLDQNIQLMSAEAHFQKGNYSNAVDLYDLALNSGIKRVEPIIYYHQGLANYRLYVYEKAIEAFKIAALSKDSIGQYGSYNLGLLYTTNGNLPFAINAFDEAASASHNQTISAESAFRASQASYEMGQYSASITRLQNFIENFPESSFIPRANDLLGEAFLRTSNYDQAITHIEGLPERSRSINRVYQEVTLHKATQLFNDSRFIEAIAMFDKSLSVAINRDLIIQAHYWKGEAYSIGKKWVEAINSYSAVVFNRSFNRSPFYLKSRYGLAYAYYNNKIYDRAKIQFAEYTNGLNGNYGDATYLDGLVRLGDCYFVEKNYSAAISNYESALRGRSQDQAYIYFQLGLSNGFNNNNAEAIRNFQVVINRYGETREAERSTYQLGQVYFEGGDYEEAIQGFTGLINGYPTSKLIPNALVKRAVSNYNLGNYQSAQSDYQAVLDRYITHPTANSALLGLQEIGSVSGAEINIEQYIAKYREANPDDSSLQNIVFEAAKSKYFDQDYSDAIVKLKAFISDYGNSSFVGEAYYFLGDSYNRSNNAKDAIENFKMVLEYPQVTYYNRALTRLGDLNLAEAQFNEAINYFKRLQSSARGQRDTYNALFGLMKSHEKLKSIDSVKYYAGLILEEKQVSANGVSSANLALGKAAIDEGQYLEAMGYLDRTTEIADDEYAAEATYLKGYIYHQQKDFERSNEVLFEMNSKFSYYEYWLGKSFLLIADNYLVTDELFQAKATLNSIIENSPISEVVEMATEKLKIISDREQEILTEKDTLSPDTTVNQSKP